MCDASTVLALRDARPFTPFRFHLCDGRVVDVPSEDVVLPCREYAVVGHPDGSGNPRVIDGWTSVAYSWVTHVEVLVPGRPNPAAW